MDQQTSSWELTKGALQRIMYGRRPEKQDFAHTVPAALSFQSAVPDSNTPDGVTSHDSTSAHDVTDVEDLSQQHGNGGGGMTTSGPGAQGNSGGSNELASFLKLLTGLVLAAGSVYFYTHDTQPNRAKAELAMLDNQAKDRQVELEKEKTKQMRIAAEAASVGQAPIQAPPQNFQQPNIDQPLRIIRVKPGEQWGMTENIRFIFSQYPNSDPSARVFLTAMPKSYQGSFLLVDAKSRRQAWTQGWSSEQSPDIDQFFADFVTPGRSEHLILIYSRGESTINM